MIGLVPLLCLPTTEEHRALRTKLQTWLLPGLRPHLTETQLFCFLASFSSWCLIFRIFAIERQLPQLPASGSGSYQRPSLILSTVAQGMHCFLISQTQWVPGAIVPKSPWIRYVKELFSVGNQGYQWGGKDAMWQSETYRWLTLFSREKPTNMRNDVCSVI